MRVHYPPLTPIPAPQWPYGCRPEDIPHDLTTWDGWRLGDLIPTDRLPPTGWYSVGYWLALISPSVLLGFGQPLPISLAEMEEEANAACLREGIGALDWPAHKSLRAYGVQSVRLFPDPILRSLCV